MEFAPCASRASAVVGNAERIRMSGKPLVDAIEKALNAPIEAKSENEPQESETKEEKQEPQKEEKKKCKKGTCPIPKVKKQTPIRREKKQRTIPKPPDTKSYTTYSKTDYHQCLECQNKIDKYHQFCSEKCRKNHLRNYINHLRKSLEE